MKRQQNRGEDWLTRQKRNWPIEQEMDFKQMRHLGPENNTRKTSQVLPMPQINARERGSKLFPQGQKNKRMNQKKSMKNSYYQTTDLFLSGERNPI